MSATWKLTRNLGLCAIVVVVVANGPAIAEQNQADDIILRSDPRAVQTEGTQAVSCGAIGHPGFLIGQDPHGPGDPDWDIMSSHQTTWGTYIMAESVDQAADPDWFDIDSLTVWGFSVVISGGVFVCDTSGMNFNVVFYEENLSLPGAVICDLQSVVPAVTNTGVQYDLGGSPFDLLQFDLPAACNLGSVGRKWITVQSEPNPLDCGFLWLSGTGGDGISYQDGGAGWMQKDNDRSICINGATVPVELTSFRAE